jgi:hypothetical protein
VKGALEVERLSLRELCEGNLEGGLLYWGPLSKTLEMGVCFHRVPALKDHGGTLTFLWPLGEGKNLFYLFRKILMRNLRDT